MQHSASVAEIENGFKLSFFVLIKTSLASSSTTDFSGVGNIQADQMDQ